MQEFINSVVVVLEGNASTVERILPIIIACMMLLIVVLLFVFIVKSIMRHFRKGRKRSKNENDVR